MPMWRSLWHNLRDRFASDRTMPLQITAKPVDVGMLLGDAVSLPWFRTVFSNVGDVIAPETAPPLQLESHPVDTGELISDQLQHGWWTSLLRNLADAAAPEQLPPLHLTAAPVAPEPVSGRLLVPRWSALISTPQPPINETSVPLALSPGVPGGWNLATGVTFGSPSIETDSYSARHLIDRARRGLRLAHWREAFWISAAVAEVLFLVFWLFGRR